MDSRDWEANYGRSGEGFDEKSMTITMTLEDDEGEEREVVFPARYIVCELCDGKGSHVNPSIDAHGLTAEDFAEDPDFRDDYMSGMYDEPCYRCHGKRVEPVVDESRLDEQGKKDYKEYLDNQADLAEMYREMEAERRMGA